MGPQPPQPWGRIMPGTPQPQGWQASLSNKYHRHTMQDGWCMDRKIITVPQLTTIHLPAHHAGWMVYGWSKALFRYISVAQLTCYFMDSYVLIINMYLVATKYLITYLPTGTCSQYHLNSLPSYVLMLIYLHRQLLSSVRWKYLEGLQDVLPRWYNSVMVHPQLSHNSFQRMAHWWVMGHKIFTSFVELIE